MKTIFTLIIFCFISVCLKAQFLQNSMLDYSFGYKGRVSTSDDYSYYKFGSEAKSVLIQNDGKILIAGNSFVGLGGDILFIRYKPRGEVDSSFGQNGFVHYGHKNDPDFLDYLTQAKLQPDGRIVVSGYTFKSQFLMRFLPNGKVDSSFGEKGKVQLLQNAFSIDIDKNNNIITCESYNEKPNLIFAIQRFDKNGNPDLNFGKNNLVKLVIGAAYGSAYNRAKVKLDKTGKIIVGGSWYPPDNNNKSITVIQRLFNDGKIDSSFNNNIGRLQIDGSGQSVIFGNIGFQSDNKIIVGTSITKDSYSQADFMVMRLNNDGIIDSTFGINGSITTDFSRTLPLKSDYISSLCIQNDDKIIAAGTSQRSLDDDFNYSFSLCRYNSNGVIDSSFGQAGLEKTSFGNNLDCSVYDATLQPDGKIILTGSHNIGLTPSGQGNIAIARYNKKHIYLETSDISNNKIEESSTSLYPNPTKNILHIEGLNANMQYTIMVTNQNGATVTSTQINKIASYNLNVENLSKGVYYISITSNQNTVTKKFIKE